MTPWLCEDYVDPGSGGGSGTSTRIATRIVCLTDAITCRVNEERNGAYTLELTYPINGNGWASITTDKLIEAQVNDAGDIDYFRIFSVEKDSGGTMTVRANHISYDLSYMYFDPPMGGIYPSGQTLNAESVWNAIVLVCPEASDYTFTSDVTKEGGFLFPDGVMGVRNTITGTENEDDFSVLGLWGGELKWYRREISLLQSRGAEKKASISYGDNVVRITSEVNSESHYGGVMGYITWVNPDDENATVHYNKSTVYFTNRTTDRLMLVDLTDYLGDTEVQTSSQAQILVDGYTQSYAKKMQKTHNKAYTTETVEAAPTWYDPTSGGVPLALCDTVTLNYEPFGIEKKVKVVATEYDVLVERYSKITLGDPRTNFVDTYISNAQSASAAKVTSDMYPQMWKNEIQQATKSIANLGERINGNGSSITLSSGTTATDIASFTLTKGKWMVTCTGRFEENGTGNRMVRLASSSGGSAINYSVIALSRAASAGRTYVQFCAPITVSSSSSTYYIVGYQTSGGNLDVIGRWDAIRIL